MKLKPKAWGLLGLLVLAVCFSSEATAQMPGYGGSSPAATEVRLQQLEMQLRELTGKIEEQNYQIRQMQERLDKALGDMDMRLQDAERGGAPTGGSFTSGGSSAQSGGYPPSPPGSSDTGNYQWSSNNNTGGEPSSPGQLGGSADATAAAAYENAYALLKGGKYDQAEKEFQAFMERYPTHVLAGNAQYWLGETYYVRGDYDRAARTFAAAYKNYPKSAKAADNLLKLGMALAAQGSKDDACTALGQIGREFSSAGPVLQRAKQEMTRLGCS